MFHSAFKVGVLLHIRDKTLCTKSGLYNRRSVAWGNKQSLNGFDCSSCTEEENEN